jgi:tRNA and rRNA cytosine-C5-methylases
MTSTSDSTTKFTPWAHAARLVARWIESGERVDALLETLPRGLTGVERGRCQNLFLGAVRHRGRLDAHLRELITLPPRPRVQGVLLVAGYELIEGGDEHHAARVGHYAVEQAKRLANPAEVRLINAVVRKLAAGLATEPVPSADAPVAELARYFSHPEWLVQRWLGQFGQTATRALLEWNQKPATVYARWRDVNQAPDDNERMWLVPTEWPSFYEVKPGSWSKVETALAAGRVYLQDPATRLSVDLLAPRAGESVLDLCAAPGGKSMAIADRMGSGTLVAVDLPERAERLKDNFSRISGVSGQPLAGDFVAEGEALFARHDLPKQYAAVLIDVPCSNTGVMRHRADVKWRLRAGDFAQHAAQQLRLLRAAAALVSEGGRLVYSTCSLDREENEAVAEAFVRETNGQFDQIDARIAQPWTSGHDGAAAFLFKRVR